MATEYTVPAEALRIDGEMKQVWEQIPLRTELPPVQYVVTQEKVDLYLDAVGGPTSPGEAAGWVPPELFCGDYGPLTQEFGQTVGFHANHKFTAHRPLAIGATVTATGTVTDKFERRGFRYFTLSFTHSDEDGQPVVTNETTIAVGVLRDPNYKPEPRAPRLAGGKSLEPTYAPIATVTIDQPSMAAFAAQGALRWGWEDTGGGAHTDELFAQSAGLEQTNAQSLHYVGWMARHLASSWGADWWRRGGLNVKFVSQVGPNDTLRLEATVDDGRERLVRVVNDRSDSVICIGAATMQAGEGE